jgi:putative heme iron utilization protein
MIGQSGTAVLSTLTVDPAGFPFGSVVAYAADQAGNPLFVISELAEHTRNLRADGRASLLVTESRDESDPLASGRVTVIGEASPVPAARQDEATAFVVGHLPAVGGYANYGDFSCWRLDVGAIRWVGGFGRMDWVDPAAFRAGAFDPVLVRRRDVIEHMNADHADAGILLCQRALDTASDGPPATVTAASFDHVDRFGCDYTATTDRGTASIRLAFEHPATSVDEVRASVVALVRAARGS